MPLKLSLCLAAAGVLPLTGLAASYTITAPIADAFLSSNAPSSNFGGAGTLDIAAAGLSNGAYDSVIQFNTASAASLFNTTYGAGNWTVTGFTLMLASSFGTANAVPNNAIFNNVSGGDFGVDLLDNNSWVEGAGTPAAPSATGVNFNSIPALLGSGYDALGTYLYAPPGNNVYASYSLPLDSGLVSGTAAGGNVSFFFYAADNQISYLINSRSFSTAKPELVITAVPEPASAALLVLPAAGWLASRLWTRKK